MITTYLRWAYPIGLALLVVGFLATLLAECIG